MKKGLLLICAVLCAALVLFSCTPVADCGYVTKVQDTFFKSTLTLGVAGMNQSARTILPNDWTDQRAGELHFVLTGSRTSGGQNEITDSNRYTYQEMTTGSARIALDPAIWYLTMTAYQDAELTNKVMQSELAEVDLRGGNTSKTFSLFAVSETEATGDVKVSIEFPKPARFKSVTSGLYITGAIENDDLAVEGVTPVTTEVDGLTSVNAANSIYSFTYTQNTVKAGVYFFSAKFLDVDDNVIAFISEPVIIDGGNLSEAAIELPDIFGKPPVAPTNLTVSSYNYNGTGMNAVELDATGTAPAVYEAVLTWTDNSNNETGFELIVTDTASGGTVIANTIKAGNLNASSQTVTIELETGKVYDIKLRAVNNYSPSAETDTYATTNGINLFTVTYDLTEGKVQKDNDNATGNEIAKFVMPYKKSATATKLLSAETAKFPYVQKANFNFVEWLDGDDVIAEIPAGNTANMSIKAYWSSTLTSTVELQSYSKFRGNLIAGYANYSSITVTGGETLELSGADGVTNMTFDLRNSAYAPAYTGVTFTDTSFSFVTTNVPAGTYNLIVKGKIEGKEIQQTLFIEVTR